MTLMLSWENLSIIREGVAEKSLSVATLGLLIVLKNPIRNHFNFLVQQKSISQSKTALGLRQ